MKTKTQMDHEYLKSVPLVKEWMREAFVWGLVVGICFGVGMAYVLALALKK